MPDDTALTALCAAHPEHAGTFLQLHDDFGRARQALAGHPDAEVINADHLAAVVADIDRPRAADAYQMATPLARGMDTQVEQVWDVRLRRRVARKTLRIDFRRRDLSAAETARVQRFLAEAIGLARLQHPSIPPVHELGVDERGVFFTTPVVQGTTFASILEAQSRGDSRWTRARALQTLAQVCDALSHAQARGVTHRNVTAQNLIVGRFGEAIILGWGRANWPALPLGAKGGDIAERATGDPAGEATTVELNGDRLTDLRALGAILGLILATSGPHDQATAPRAARIDSRPSPELRSIHARAIASTASSGYTGVRDLARDLRAFLEERVVQAHAHGARARLRAWIRRNRVLAAATAIAALAVCVSVVVVIAVRAQEQESLRKARDELRREQTLADKRLNALQTSAYANDLATAHDVLREGRNVGQVRTLLDRCEASMRGIEWQIVHALADQSVRTFMTSSGTESGMALAADGSVLASGTQDAHLRVWDTRSGIELVDIRTPSAITSIALSPDGRLAGSSHHDRFVRIFDTRTGEQVDASQQLDDVQKQVAFAAGGCLVSVGNDLTVRVWTTPTVTLVRSFPSRVITSPRIGLDARGELLAVADWRDRLAVFEIASGKCLYESTVPGGMGVACPEFNGDASEVRAIGGRGIFRGNLAERTADLRPLPEGTTSAGGVHLLDGKQIALLAATSIVVFETASMRRIGTWHGHAADNTAMVADPAGRWLYSADASGAIKQWDLHHPVERVLVGPAAPVTSLACAPDGSSVAALCGDGRLWLWNLDDGPTARSHELGLGPLGSVRWLDPASGRGTLAVTSADGTSHAVAAATWRTTPRREATARVSSPTQPDRVTTADGTRMVDLGGPSRDEIVIRSVTRDDALLTLQLPAAGTQLAVSADGRVVAAGLADGRIAAWVVPR